MTDLNMTRWERLPLDALPALLRTLSSVFAVLWLRVTASSAQVGESGSPQLLPLGLISAVMSE